MPSRSRSRSRSRSPKKPISNYNLMVHLFGVGMRNWRNINTHIQHGLTNNIAGVKTNKEQLERLTKNGKYKEFVNKATKAIKNLSSTRSGRPTTSRH